MFSMRRIIGLCLVGVWLCAAAVVWAGANEDYQKAKDKQAALEKASDKQKFRDSWLKLIDAFSDVVSHYPKSKVACDARYNLGKSYAALSELSHARGDRKRALDAYEDLAKNCRDTSLADDGLFHAAEIYVKLGNKEKAKQSLKQLLASYPTSDQRQPARALLAELGEKVPDDPPARPAKSAPKAPAPVAEPVADAPKEAPSHGSAQLKRFEFQAGDGQVVAELSFSRLPTFARGEIPENGDKPRRVFFDFLDTVQAPDFMLPKLENDPCVTAMRLSAYKPTILRVVFELQPACGNVEVENDRETAVARLRWRDKNAPKAAPAAPVAQGTLSVIARDEPTPAKEKPAEKPVEKPIAKDEPTPPPSAASLNGTPARTPDREAGRRVKRVVVDAGHGGKDNGAIGKGGTAEKEITLQIARRLKAILESEQGLEVVLTRDRDEYLTLYDRTKVANDLDADLFVSVHCNANRQAKHRGVETFYLNNSADTYSRRLAERENQEFGQPITDLDFILTDLSMNVNITESIALAESVQKSVVHQVGAAYKGIEDRGVRRAVFHVLLYARMPAILVETSFISNPIEEKLLRTPEYQTELAHGIAEGIRTYSQKQNRVATQL